MQQDPIDSVLMPNGQVQRIDKNQKLYVLAMQLRKSEEIIFSMVGKPTAPVYKPIVDAEKEYWNNVDCKHAIDYGQFQGQEKYRAQMAEAISRIYNVKIGKEAIVFTGGGRLAIAGIVNLVHAKSKDKYVVTTSLFYHQHTGISYTDSKGFKLLLVDVEKNMESLTAQNLTETLKDIQKDQISAFFFCDPNNPMGKVVGEEQWKKIIPIFQKYENSIIVLDEAYAQMVFDKPHVSLFSLADEKLRKRIILLRSGTKGFSVSGQRMAVLISENNEYTSRIVQFQASNLLHAPKSAQFAYTNAMKHFNAQEQMKLADFYKPTVRQIEKVLLQTNFNIKNPGYRQVDATFYVMCDMSELIGKQIPQNMLKYYANKNKKVVQNNIDIGMYLLFKYKIALMPMYYFGAKLHSGLIRITCSFQKEGELEKTCQIFRKLRQDLSN